MLKCLISPQAEKDLEIIFEFTYNHWSYEQSVKYQNDLNNGFARICQYPQIAKHYTYKRGDYHFLQINKHLIFYKTNASEIIIMRILHENMNLQDNI